METTKLPALGSYADWGTPRELSADCRATGVALGLHRLERAARTAATRSAPSLAYQDFPQGSTKPEISISAAALALANALHLHLD
jgi:hypothetical protein